MYFQTLQNGISQWGDESETIVTARLLHSGERLYEEIFNHHGPLTFLGPYLVDAFGPQSLQVQRLQVTLLQLICVILVAYPRGGESSFKSKFLAILTAATFSLVFPSFLGSTVQYQTFAGLIAFVMLFKWVLPIIVMSSNPNFQQIFLFSALAGALPFLGFIYLPFSACVLIAVIISSRRSWLAVLTGLIATICLNLIWLMSIGSLRGFLAIHIHVNSVTMRDYGLSTDVPAIVLGIATSILSNLPLLLLLFILFLHLAMRNEPKLKALAAILVLFAGLASLLARGLDFHATPFYYALLALFVFFLRDERFIVQPRSVAAWIIIVIVTIRLTGLLPPDQIRFGQQALPTWSDLSKFIQGNTTKSDRVLIYTFRPYEYLLADRLPATGSFFYLPWQRNYADHPVLGVSLDPCEQLKDAEPKLVSLDRWKVWDTYSWNDYGSCIEETLKADYVETSLEGVYLRDESK